MSIVSINAGGKLFQISSTLLGLYPESALTRMTLEQDRLSPAHRDQDGNLFLDIDPNYFGLIIDFLRHNSFFLPEQRVDFFSREKLWHLITYLQLPIPRYHNAQINHSFNLKLFQTTKYTTQELERIHHRIWSHQSGEIAFHYPKCKCKLHTTFIDQLQIRNLHSRSYNQSFTLNITSFNGDHFSFTKLIEPNQKITEPINLHQNTRLCLLDLSFSLLENTTKPSSISVRNQLKITFDLVINYRFERDIFNEKSLTTPKSFLFALEN